MSKKGGFCLNWRLALISVAPENQYTVFFDDVRVPRGNLIGEENNGFEYIFDGLNTERIAIASIALGYGEYVLEKAVKHAAERKLYEEPIGAYQGIQHMLVRAKVGLELADLATQKAAELYDNNQDAKVVGMWANMAKLADSEAACNACDVAIQVHGGYGLVKDYDIITVWPLLRTLRVAPINNEMVLNYIGQNILSLPKSYR